MNKKELEYMLNTYNDFVEERLQDNFTKVSGTNIYQERKKHYEEVCNSLLEKCSNIEIEKLTATLCSINDIENTYAYLMGLADGTRLNKLI